MANLTPEQTKVLTHIVAIGRQMNATPRQIKAAIETGLVESNLTNPSGGDADSAGWRQERASLYPDPTNLNDSIRRFFTETQKAGNFARAGDLAAAVQRPAAQYRGRYQQESGVAQQLLRQFGAPTAGTSAGPSGTTTTSTSTVGGVNHSKARGALIASFLEGADPRLTAGTAAAGQQTTDPLSFVTALKGLADVPGHQVTTTTNTPNTPNTSSSDTSSPSSSGLAKFDGKQVAGWIAPILKQARATGLWHGTVNSGYRSDAQQKAIYDSGVRPAAVPKSEGGSGSNHEGANFPYGAVDVSDAQGLAAALRKLGINRLQYAGSKDPVHFSHPRNGTY